MLLPAWTERQFWECSGQPYLPQAQLLESPIPVCQPPKICQNMRLTMPSSMASSLNRLKSYQIIIWQLTTKITNYYNKTWECCVSNAQALLTAPPQCFVVVHRHYVEPLWCWSLLVLPSDCAADFLRRTRHEKQHAYSTPGESGNYIIAIKYYTSLFFSHLFHLGNWSEKV